MGQYYTPVLTQDDKTILFNNRTALQTEEEKKEYEQNSYSNYHGLKILEHSWWENTLVKGVIGRLYNKVGRLAWVGDYTETEYVVSNDGTKAPLTSIELYARNLYKRNADGSFFKNERGYKEEIENSKLPKGIRRVNLVRYKQKFTLDNKLIINLTRKEILDCDTYFKRSKMSDGWCINPLPLLTSTGGDSGGGDYHSNYIDAEQVGRWAYDEIIIKDNTPKNLADFLNKGFILLNVTFSEEIPNTKTLSKLTI